MLYVYYGNDRVKARAKVRKTIQSLQKKQPNALFMRIYGDEFLRCDPLELTASQGLFKSEYIVLLDSILVDAQSEQAFCSALKALAQAPHVFLVLQGSLSQTLLKEINKHAAKVEEFSTSAGREPSREFSFALADALLARDKNALWKHFHTDLRLGRPAEEIAGTLFWSAKTIVLGHVAQSAEHAGLKEYSFKKARMSATRFSADEAQTLVHALALAQANAFSQGAPLALVLEHILLTHV